MLNLELVIEVINSQLFDLRVKTMKSAKIRNKLRLLVVEILRNEFMNKQILESQPYNQLLQYIHPLF